MNREPVEIHPRKPLTKRQRAQLALDQNGLCGCGCGEKLDHAREGTIDEHVLALALGGVNDLHNRSLWRKPCATEKTRGDVRAIAKVKRIIAKSSPETRKPPKMKSGGVREKPPGFKHSWPKRRFGA